MRRSSVIFYNDKIRIDTGVNDQIDFAVTDSKTSEEIYKLYNEKTGQVNKISVGGVLFITVLKKTDKYTEYKAEFRNQDTIYIECPANNEQASFNILDCFTTSLDIKLCNDLAILSIFSEDEIWIQTDLY